MYKGLQYFASKCVTFVLTGCLDEKVEKKCQNKTEKLTPLLFSLFLIFDGKSRFNDFLTSKSLKRNLGRLIYVQADLISWAIPKACVIIIII